MYWFGPISCGRETGVPHCVWHTYPKLNYEKLPELLGRRFWWFWAVSILQSRDQITIFRSTVLVCYYNWMNLSSFRVTKHRTKNPFEIFWILTLRPNTVFYSSFSLLHCLSGIFLFSSPSCSSSSSSYALCYRYFLRFLCSFCSFPCSCYCSYPIIFIVLLFPIFLLATTLKTSGGIVEPSFRCIHLLF